MLTNEQKIYKATLFLPRPMPIVRIVTTPLSGLRATAVSVVHGVVPSRADKQLIGRSILVCILVIIGTDSWLCIHTQTPLSHSTISIHSQTVCTSCKIFFISFLSDFFPMNTHAQLS